MKIAKVISKVTKARDAARKKSYSAAPGVERGKKSSRTSPLPTTGKQKAIAREKKYGTASHKVAKQNDSFVNQYAKYAKKSGSNLKGNQALAGAVAPKSVSKKVGPKVPVKRRSK